MSDPFTQYQQWKVILLNILLVTADAFHIYLGLGLFLVTCGIRRQVSLSSLLPGLLISLIMETLDFLYQGAFIGVLSWDGCIHDLIHTNLAPFLIVVVVSYWKERSHVTSPVTGS